MSEIMSITGRYLFEGFNKDGNKVFEKEYKNVVTNGFFGTVINFLDYTTDQPGNTLNITHIALGIGTNEASKDDTKLVNEIFRKKITTKSRTNNKYVCKLLIDGNEANFIIREVGTFVNTDNTVNNGLLISRTNVFIEKTSSIQYLITFTLTIQ